MAYLDRLFENIKKDGLIESDEGIEVNTPFNFSELEDDEDDDEVPTSVPNSSPFEETFKRINAELDKLNEISYKDFKADDTLTVKKKLNNSIHEINKGLAHAEKLIGHALKLKMEVGADQTIFFKETFRKFTKIGERMNRLQSKIREFSK